MWKNEIYLYDFLKYKRKNHSIRLYNEIIENFILNIDLKVVFICYTQQLQFRYILTKNKYRNVVKVFLKYI